MKRFRCISKKPLDWFFPLHTGKTEFEPGEVVEVDNPRDVVRLSMCPDKFEFIPEDVKPVKENKTTDKKESETKKTEEK